MRKNEEELPGGEKLGALIRRACAPPEGLKAPADMAIRVRRLAEERAANRSLWSRLWEYFAPPSIWVPVTAGGLALLLAVIVIPQMPFGAGRQSNPSGERVASTESGLAASQGSTDDPLGPDFFKFEGVPDEEVSVELADGWNAVTIEDEENDTALVYFFSEEGSANGNPKAQ